jgi:hypothetical protein
MLATYTMIEAIEAKRGRAATSQSANKPLT